MVVALEHFGDEPVRLVVDEVETASVALNPKSAEAKAIQRITNQLPAPAIDAAPAVWEQWKRDCGLIADHDDIEIDVDALKERFSARGIEIQAEVSG
jgi:predicted secreted Zn-dependent protease